MLATAPREVDDMPAEDTLHPHLRTPTPTPTKPASKQLALLEPTPAKAEAGKIHIGADSHSAPHKATKTENYSSSQTGNCEASKVDFAAQKWFDQQSQVPTTTSTSRSFQTGDALIDFGDDERKEIKPAEHVVPAVNQPEEGPRTSVVKPAISTVTPGMRNAALSLRTNGKENMPLVTYSVSPSPRSTTQAPDLLPSPQFHTLSSEDTVVHKTEPGAAYLGFPSTPKIEKSNSHQQNDPAAFIKAYHSIRPSFASKWSTPSKISSLAMSPTEEMTTRPEADEELEEGEIVENEAKNTTKAEYPKPLFSCDEDSEVGEMVDSDQRWKGKGVDVYTKDEKTWEVARKFPEEGGEQWQESKKTAEDTGKTRNGISHSNGKPEQKWANVLARGLSDAARDRNLEDPFAKAKPALPPSGTRVLGGDLDEECKEMVLSPGGGYHALETESKAGWKPVIRGQGAEERVCFVLDQADGW